MAPSSHVPSIARFSGFELDLRTGDLIREGKRLKLPPQPSKILVLLVGRAGEVVTRQEIVQEIWGSETFVDFEQGLNFAIRQIRSVLEDNVEQPRFVETIPKRGYCFTAPVELAGVFQPPVLRSATPPRHYWLTSRITFSMAAAALLILSSFVYLRLREKRLHAAVRPLVIAVLPFDDLSGDPQPFLVEGLTEEMIARVTQINPELLKVVGRTSAMQYERTRKGAREIGQELGADYVLENSIRHEAGRLRITSQLVRASDQTHVWAESYERDMRELLPLESEVSEDIAEQIQRKLFPALAPPPTINARAVDPEAHELYLKARYAFNQRSRDSLDQSVTLYQQAVAKQPDYAAAYAGLADSYNLIGFYGFDPAQNLVSQAKISAQKALQLDPSFAPAHAALAYTDFMWQQDWPNSEKEFRRALELDDNYVPAHQWYAFYLAGAGRMDEAINQMRYALRLDPLSVSAQTGVGYMYYLARDYDRAIHHASLALQLNANSMAAHEVLGWSFTEQSKFPDAISELQTALRLSGEVPVYLCGLARAHALSGNLSEARAILARAEIMEPSGGGSAIAAVYLALGENEKALRWLESTAPGDLQSNWLLVDPAFDRLRQEKRFAAVCTRIRSRNQTP